MSASRRIYSAALKCPPNHAWAKQKSVWKKQKFAPLPHLPYGRCGSFIHRKVNKIKLKP